MQGPAVPHFWLTRTLAVILSCLTLPCLAESDWTSYLGDEGRRHYSSLNQLTPANVSALKPAWTYRSGDARRDSQIQCNPLIIEGVLYGVTAGLQLAALDAANGRELWRFNPFAVAGNRAPTGVSRGVVHWKEADDRRVLFSADHYLYAVAAKTGQPIKSFGDGGRVDLKQDLGRDISSLYLVVTTPPAVYKDILVLGFRTGEGPGPAAPGHIRGYDIRTGKLRWRFHTIPHPGELGFETWPSDAWTRVGGANSWAGIAVDAERGIAFVPTGSATYDFWGGNRMGENLFANCLIALDATTGRRLWHYQFVRHDVWDRDLPAPPTLITVQREGKSIDAVAQITKSGHVFVFDRESGAPLFPIAEQPAPSSDLQGEATWPTQPVPLKPKPFARQLFSYEEITDISPESHREVLERFYRLRPHSPFAPPSLQGTIVFPGFDGGGEWGGAAADPNGVLYVNGNEMPWIITMAYTPPAADGAPASGSQLYAQICAACHGADRRGNPAQNVPTLVDLSTRVQRADVLQLLEKGRGMMPSFNFLSPAQKEALANEMLGTSDHRFADTVAESVGPEATGITAAPYTVSGFHRWFDTNGYPAVKPPWGTLNAIDLNTGEYRWTIPLGEDPALTARGIPPTGLENYGGPLVTAGGLLFIGATKDEMFRAFDRRNGALLWSYKLPAGGYATPATYMAAGKQFVVIACGGGKMGTMSADAYVAFSLPD